VPRTFGRDFMWEPYESLRSLRYTEVPETTQAVENALAKSPQASSPTTPDRESLIQ
jgi:hypothetical protein